MITSKFEKEIIGILNGEVYNNSLGLLSCTVNHMEFLIVDFKRLFDNPPQTRTFFDYKQMRLSQNINVIFLWEDLYNDRPKLFLNRLNALLGKRTNIDARATSVVPVTTEHAKQFLLKHHINSITKSKYRYALVYRYQIVALATFSKSCPIHRDGRKYISHELIRFCNHSRISVVGGLSKLIHHFRQGRELDDIMTYADLDWSDGKSYKTLGFQAKGFSNPYVFYISKSTHRRFNTKDISETCASVDDDLIKLSNAGSCKYILEFN